MKRINQIIDLITEPYFALIDIGSDHGYLGIKILQTKKIQEVWNVDISKRCLETSRKNCEKFNCLSNSYFYLSDGFNSLKQVPDNSIAIIAGLGTKTILKILNNNLPENLHNIICLPHNPPILLRKWAVKNNWDIVNESYFEDKKHVYLIIKLKKTNTLNKKINVYIGDISFLNSQYDLSFKYWTGLKEKISSKPEQYLLDWEKEFLLSWKNYNKSIKLK